MKKVLYVLTSLSHKRCFETFEPRSDIEQLIVGPQPVKNEGIVPEDYSDFRIKNIKYAGNTNGIQKIVNQYKPDIYVQASLPCAKGISLPVGCKKVYVSHGMVGNHVIPMIKPGGFNTSVWKGCDLYCGATQVFADWVKHVAKVGDDKILLNALPQLDIIHDKQYCEKYKAAVVKKAGFTPSKILLFVGFCCKDRYDFVNHNEDYFRTVLELDRIAKRHNWLVMVKPRQTYGAMKKFLKAHGWGKKYLKPYADVQQSKNLHFITTSGHIYRYFFADAIVINGTSTVEVEACAINKPLFIVKTCLKNRTDPYDMLKTRAGMSIPDMAELEHDLVGYFKHGKFHDIAAQNKRMADMKITFDGKMHQRIQDRLARM